MPTYQRIFVVPDVVKVHAAFLRAEDSMVRWDQWRRARGAPPIFVDALATLRDAHNAWNRELTDIARVTSLQATQNIVKKIRETNKRPDTGISPHLRDRIVCRSLGSVNGYATGTVGIADEDVLNAGRTGLYWRAQEFGSGSDEVASISTAATGRWLRGYFYQTGFRGYPSPPDADLAGVHPVFRQGPPLGGAKVPLQPAAVVNEIKARHFIRDGADAARVKWRASVEALQAQALAVVEGVI